MPLRMRHNQWSCNFILLYIRIYLSVLFVYFSWMVAINYIIITLYRECVNCSWKVLKRRYAEDAFTSLSCAFHCLLKHICYSLLQLAYKCTVVWTYHCKHFSRPRHIVWHCCVQTLELAAYFALHCTNLFSSHILAAVLLLTLVPMKILAVTRLP